MSQLHREFPEATETELEVLYTAARFGLGQFASETEPVEDDDRATRSCRDCGSDYTVPADKATASSKWYSLCSSCLAWEV